MLTFLEERGLRLLFFGGKGGVGKTTGAVAAALRLAQTRPRDTFLLVSTDPAHSLADSLADLPPPANLTVLEFQSQACLEAFKGQHRGKLEEIASRGTFLDREDIRQLLDLSLPGLDELMALLEISRWVDSARYGVIIVDTAPSGHTLRLLTMPEVIRRWLKALDALLAKHRFMRQRFRGSYHSDELDEFLLDLAVSVEKMEGLLRDPARCRFVPVTLAEEVVLRETVALLGQLKRMRVPVQEIIVNQLYPESSCPVCAGGRRRQLHLLKTLRSRGKMAGCTLWGVPLYPEEVRGQALAAFWDGAWELPETTAAISEAPEAPAPRVENPSAAPSPGLTFLIFAGKGGVGKTTLACATALRLAQEFPGKEVFLFSTDPAHSLCACLEAAVGPRPTWVAPGLTAMEMDAEADFAVLKQQFQEEVERVFKRLLENFDLPFDREVVQRLLDLSPPGLDEIMALSRAMDLLEEESYDIFLLDSAPTGHLLRLLELPDLIDQWLKTFFGVMLKYQLIRRLPELSQRLVRLSRDLKRLRALWRQPQRAALYVVTILTEMAFQETLDLVAAGQGLGMHVPVIFLNQATPAGNCDLCAALRRREAEIQAKFQETCPGMCLPLIYRGGEPRGRQLLSKLGQALYRPGGQEDREGAAADLPALSS